MGIYKEEAIVLRSMAYGEADQDLTLFTRGTGKVAAIAKGVRKPSSRLRGAVQLFSHSHLVIYSGKNLDTISQGDADENFSFIEQDLGPSGRSKLLYGTGGPPDHGAAAPAKAVSTPAFGDESP